MDHGPGYERGRGRGRGREDGGGRGRGYGGGRGRGYGRGRGRGRGRRYQKSGFKQVLEIPEYENTMNVTRKFSQNITTPELQEWCRKKGFTRYIVPFKSDTLFRCAARGMLLSNVNFVEVKSFVCQYLWDNRDEYEDRVKLAVNFEQNVLASWKLNIGLMKLGQDYSEIAGEAQSIWDVYMYRLECTKMGGCFIDAEVISKIFNCDVFIYRDLRNEPYTYHGTGDFGPPQQLHLLSLYGVLNQFDLLMPVVDTGAGGSGQSYIYRGLYKSLFKFDDAVGMAVESQKARKKWDKKHPYQPKPLPFPRDVEGSLDPNQLKNPLFYHLRNERRWVPGGLIIDDGSDDPPWYAQYGASETEFIGDYHDPTFDYEAPEELEEHSFQDFWNMLEIVSELDGTAERTESISVNIEDGEPNLESVLQDAEDAQIELDKLMACKLHLGSGDRSTLSPQTQ